MNELGGNSKLAVVDVEAKLGSSIANELEITGWRVSRCHGSFKAISLPKYHTSILICDADDFDEKERQYQELRARNVEENVLIIFLDGSPNMTLINGSPSLVVPAANAIDVANMVETIAVQKPEKSNPQSETRSLRYGSEMIRWMTWREEGLPPEAIEYILNRFKSLKDLFDSFKTEANLDESDKCSCFYQEVKQFFSEDYYIDS